MSEYWTVLQHVLRGLILKINMPGREVTPGIWAGLNASIHWDKVMIESPVYIGQIVCIETGATTIGPSWMEHDSHIRSDAKLVRSFLFEYTRIAADMHFADMIASTTNRVGRAGDNLDRDDGSALLHWGDDRA